MRITRFRIKNFKSIRLAECSDPPDFMVVCGGNGCGKSALLAALVFAKEASGSYANGPSVQSSAVSADASQCQVSFTMAFTDAECAFLRAPPNLPHPQYPPYQPFSGSTATVEVTLRKNQPDQALSVQCPDAVRRLLSSYSRAAGATGFFDFIDAHRVYPRMQVSSWEPHSISDEAARGTLVCPDPTLMGPPHHGGSKFQLTKRYLAGMVMRDLQLLQRSQRGEGVASADSLAEFRQMFNEFLAPLRFVEVDISVTPFRYIIATPRGEIDIDDLSSGEKEILNVFARFHQLRPRDSIIFFDEADAHLHPDLQRRYLQALRHFAKTNQLWLTTHSPEMMFAAGSGHLYTLTRVAAETSTNQFLRVTQDDQLHEVLSEVMGSRGLVQLQPANRIRSKERSRPQIVRFTRHFIHPVFIMSVSCRSEIQPL